MISFGSGYKEGSNGDVIFGLGLEGVCQIDELLWKVFRGTENNELHE